MKMKTKENRETKVPTQRKVKTTEERTAVLQGSDSQSLPCPTSRDQLQKCWRIYISLGKSWSKTHNEKAKNDNTVRIIIFLKATRINISAERHGTNTK